MGISRPRRAAPHRLVLSFVLLLLLPAIAVVWLGVQLLRQDADIEARQRLERRESAADRFVVALEQIVASHERRLRDGADALGIRPDDDAVLVTIALNQNQDRMEAHPARLLYQPELPSAPPDPVAVFERADALEYRLNDAPAATAALRLLVTSPDERIRAGALVRLARNLRKLGKHREALGVYADLARLSRVFVLGLPADLVARRARGSTLQDLGRRDELHTEARALFADMLAGRWGLDTGTFRAYAGQIESWLGAPQQIPPERTSLAAAADWLWHQRGEAGASGRRALRLGGLGVTVLWQRDGERLLALIAGPRYQQREWFGALSTPEGARGLDVALTGPDDQPLSGTLSSPRDAAVRRKSAETGLPWTLYVGPSQGPDPLDGTTSRRRTLLGGLALVLLLVLAGGYLITRAVSRELAVARLQTDFVSAVSHEFRSPLTSLQQFTALLNDDDEPPPAKRRAFYQAQSRGVERLRRLVESLLDFGRMEAGARAYRPERLDVTVLVREVVADFERDGAASGFSIESNLPATPLWIDADREALSRALSNLLDNAVKYSGTSRRISVSVASRGDAVSISVRDDGLGIPRHEQEDIFTKFIRGESARTYGIKGTGIGLAMVRHIVEAHHGVIRVQSAPGAGSTFVIDLPRVLEAPPLLAPPPGAADVTEDPSCRAS